MSGQVPDGMPSMEIPDESVASAARQFRDAACLLFEKIPEQPSGYPYVLPLYMNASFSIELYLKSLNSEVVYHDSRDDLGADDLGYRLTANPVQKGHPLVKLYDAIRTDVRAKFDNAYSCKPPIQSIANLREALERYNKTFEHVRYIFEDGKALPEGSINDLVNLMRFISNFVHSFPKLEIS